MKQLKNYQKKELPTSIMNEAKEKYGGLNEEQLISKLMENIAIEKKNGTFNAEAMLSVVNMMSAYIDSSQKEKLINVIKVISAE